MARRSTPPEPQMAVLSVEKMKRGVARINRLIDELQAFDPQTIQKRWSPEVKALETAIEGALSSVFGHNTVEYNRYIGASTLDRGSVTMQIDWGGGGRREDPREAQKYLTEGKERSVQLLRQAVRWLQDELADRGEADDEADTGSAELDLDELHNQIKEKCKGLYASGEYAEAVEKSFKVVRDRLRVLTGHETGSEAFGKGRLHIRGAAADNVDSDFNEGVKFLTMSIDKFRNEKSHTSDAKISDPVRAMHYLMMSSLAMFLLDDAEIRP